MNRQCVAKGSFVAIYIPVSAGKKYFSSNTLHNQIVQDLVSSVH